MTSGHPSYLLYGALCFNPGKVLLDLLENISVGFIRFGAHEYCIGQHPVLSLPAFILASRLAVFHLKHLRYYHLRILLSSSLVGFPLVTGVSGIRSCRTLSWCATSLVQCLNLHFLLSLVLILIRGYTSHFSSRRIRPPVLLSPYLCFSYS